MTLHIIILYMWYQFFIKLFVTIWRVWRLRRSTSADVSLLSVLFTKFLRSANYVGHGLWVIISCCIFWNDEILLKISKLWSLKTDVKYFDRYKNYFFSIRPPLLQGLHKDPLNICELLWDIKMKNGVFDKYRKTRQNRAHIWHRNCKYLKKVLPVHISKSKLCTRLFHF